MYISASNLNEGPLSFDQFNAFFSLREKKTQNSCPKIGVKVIKSQSSLFNRDRVKKKKKKKKKKDLGMKTTTTIKQNKKKTYTKIMHSEKGK